MLAVVITTRNRLGSLKQCMDSLLADTFPKQIIVQDGASTDGTVEYLRQLPAVDWASEPDGSHVEGIRRVFDIESRALTRPGHAAGPQRVCADSRRRRRHHTRSLFLLVNNTQGLVSNMMQRIEQYEKETGKRHSMYYTDLQLNKNNRQERLINTVNDLTLQV